MTKTQIKELIIHIAQSCKGDGNFGATKLNKILFFADYFYYLRTGDTLTGQKYMRKQFGPVPAEIEELKAELRRKRDIAIAIEDSGMYRRERVVALRDPKLEGIDPKKIIFLQKAVEVFCRPERSWNASSMTQYSHDTIAWLSTKDRGEINPITYLFGTIQDQNKILKEDIERAKELEARYFPSKTESPQYAVA
jgi:hypothetical protein